MTEHHFISDIVNMIVNHWDVFKYLFIAYSIKYAGQGFFEFTKGLILIGMGVKKFFNR